MSEMINGLEGFDDPLKSCGGELEAPDAVRGNPLFSQAKLNALAEYWVAQYGGEGLNFTKEQERMLAGQIQDGLAAQASLLDETCKSTSDAAEKVNRGLRAERALVESSLRFAFMFARESVGIKHEGTRGRYIEAQKGRQGDVDEQADGRVRRGRQQRFAGTYKPLSSMKSPRASLEDRYDMAAIGLVRAARKFKPSASNGRFISYAAWHVQSTIDRERYETEHAGARLPADQAEKLSSYFAEYPSIGPDHVVPEPTERLLRLTEQREYPDDFGRIAEGSIEDLNDPWNEDDKPIGLAEVLDDPIDAVQLELGRALAADEIDAVLATLSEREDIVVRMRYGLGACACHAEIAAGEEHTFDQIGAVLGVTRERVRQIESKTLSILRHPKRAQLLRGIYEFIMDTDTAPATTVWRGDAIRLQEDGGTHIPDPDHPQDFSSVPPMMSDEEFATWQERELWKTRHARRESWQTYADEPWDMPLREVARPASDDDAEQFSRILHEMPTFYFSKSFGDKTGVDYPELPLEHFREQVGRKILSASQVTQIWDEFMAHTYPDLEEKLQENLDADRVGRLFSRIISEHINDNDNLVRLRIPEDLQYEIGYLASNLGLGKVEIIGNAGSHIAAWNKGFADVRVLGSVGDNAGAMMADSAQLHVSGEAGHALALGAKDDAEILVGTAKSVGQHADTVLVEQRLNYVRT